MKVKPRFTPGQILRRARRRSTAQRNLLLDLIQQAGGHLDADELYRRAREQQPHLSLSTVYRSLRLFKQLQLIDELHFEEDHHHYEGRSPREHHHLVCLGCGQVLEFESPLIQQLKTDVGGRRGFKVTSAELNLAGLCPRCREKKGSV